MLSFIFFIVTVLFVNVSITHATPAAECISKNELITNAMLRQSSTANKKFTRQIITMTTTTTTTSIATTTTTTTTTIENKIRHYSDIDIVYTENGHEDDDSIQMSSTPLMYMTHRTCIDNAKDPKDCDFNIIYNDYTRILYDRITYIQYVYGATNDPNGLQISMQRRLDMCIVCNNNERSNYICIRLLVESIFSYTQTRHDEQFVKMLKSRCESISFPIINFTSLPSINTALCSYKYVAYSSSSIFTVTMLTSDHIQSIRKNAEYILNNHSSPLAFYQETDDTDYKNQLTDLISVIVSMYMHTDSDKFVYVYETMITKCNGNIRIVCKYWLDNVAYALRGMNEHIIKSGMSSSLLESTSVYVEKIMLNMPILLLSAGHMTNASQYIAINYRLYYIPIFHDIQNFITLHVSIIGKIKFDIIYHKMSNTNPLKLMLYHTFVPKEMENSRDIFHTVLAKIVPYKRTFVHVVKSIVQFEIKLLTHDFTFGQYMVNVVKTMIDAIFELIEMPSYRKVAIKSTLSIVLMSNEETDFASVLGFRNLLGVYDPSRNRIKTFNIQFTSLNILDLSSIETVIHELVHALTYIYMPAACYHKAVCEGIAEKVTHNIIYGSYHGQLMIHIDVLSYNFNTYNIQRDLTVQALNQQEKYRNNYKLAPLVLEYIEQCKPDDYHFIMTDDSYLNILSKNVGKCNEFNKNYQGYVRRILNVLKEHSQLSRVYNETDRVRQIFKRTKLSDLSNLLKNLKHINSKFSC